MKTEREFMSLWEMLTPLSRAYIVVADTDASVRKIGASLPIFELQNC